MGFIGSRELAIYVPLTSAERVSVLELAKKTGARIGATNRGVKELHALYLHRLRLSRWESGQVTAMPSHR